MQSLKPFPDRLWFQTACFIAALIPLTLAAYYIEQRTFNGINLWTKPLKFQISGVIHLLTLFLVVRLMHDVARRAWLLRGLIWLSCVATLFEIGIITLRAGQDKASHYNFSTQTDAIIYALMGLGAISMVLPVLYLGVRFFMNKEGFSGGKGLHLGIAFGFVLATILTLAFAGYMSANGSHWTSGQDSDYGGLPLVGWSQTGGDLRPAHFFALHLMQFGPVVGLLADRWWPDYSAKSKSVILASILLLAALSVFTFKQALDGKPFMSVNPPDGLRAGEQAITEEASAFWDNLSAQCGKTFTGQMTFPEEGQDSFRGKQLTAEFAECKDDFIAVPFTVGEDTSRTWQFTKTAAGIRFKHDHRNKNGFPDSINNYGGMSDTNGSATSQHFPADDYTAQILPQARTNRWSVSLSPDGQQLRYHLERHQKPRFTAELYLKVQ